MTDWKPTACILCNINCGLQVKLEDRRIVRIKGDRDHPTSRGYLCEKPQTLDAYQSARDRLTTPLRRRPDGTHEPIDWDTAISEIAAKLMGIRDTHGGESIFYYGGGGQANHLGGAVYGRATLAALGCVFSSNALAQEKTGEFWVDSQLFGAARCHTTPDFEHAEVALFVGKNPWQSHGFPRARVVLKQIARDPARCLMVIDPRRSETARMADIHLQVRPGGDAWLLSAMVAVLIQDGLVNADFIDQRTPGFEVLSQALAHISVSDCCERAGIPEPEVRGAVARIHAASSVSVLEDLGIQQAPHSTLNSYLEKLLYLLTGNFAAPGTMNFHTGVASLGGLPGSRKRTSPVHGHRLITGLLPANAVPEEILGDHPDRFRAMIVESANPVHSLADSPAMREAMAALEVSVVIDVAMTETARLADYVLPAASQFEKWEASFFNLEFPENAFHLRAPLMDPLPGTLPESEIHARLVREMGVLDDLDLDPLREAAGRGLMAFAFAFGMMSAADRRIRRLAPVILHDILGPHLTHPSHAGLWMLAQRAAMFFGPSLNRAGFAGDGPVAGNALFEAMVSSPSGLVFSVDDYPETWARLARPDGRIQLVIPELLEELAGMGSESAVTSYDFPLILSAGERRSSTANTIYRDPSWRKTDVGGALRISAADATRLKLTHGGVARLHTGQGSAEVIVEVSEMMQPGHISLPNGQGLSYPDADGKLQLTGVSANELTAADHRDWLAGTPWHKHVPARLEPVAAG